MRRLLTVLTLLALLFAAAPARAWNGAGHRLIAAIAWRQLSPPVRQEIALLLERHPDYSRWTTRARGGNAYNVFLEAATWPDSIRHDRRFYDEGHEAPTPSFPGMADTARHSGWHYIDRLPDGRVEGELDRQLTRLSDLLRHPGATAAEKRYALPWVIHLVGDLHQPLHAGSRDDEGGNHFEIENPFNPRQPFTNLHRWWDELPGPSGLRGERLERAVAALLAAHPQPPVQGTVTLWEEESRAISRGPAYPATAGSLLPLITEEFATRSQALAERRLTEAGYRLGHLLEASLKRISARAP